MIGTLTDMADNAPSASTIRTGSDADRTPRQLAGAVVRGIGRAGVDLAGAHRGRTSAPSTYRVVRYAHEWTRGWSSAALATAYRRFPGGVDQVSAADLARLTAEHRPALEALRHDGVTRIAPLLTDEQVAALADFARTGPARYTGADGSTGITTYRDRPPTATVVRLDGEFVWARPEIQALLAHTLPAELTTALSGLTAVVHPPRLYWSCVTEETPTAAATAAAARRYHFDYDGLGGVRILINLTDVDAGAAPMEYVVGSHRPGALPVAYSTRYRNNVPPEVIEARFGDAERFAMTGPAGSCFAAVSHGLHRATSPETGDRLFLVLPLQAGALSGGSLRRRLLPPADPAFAAAVRAGRPDLRLFGLVETDQPVPIARLSA